jgi:hypothetical protein
MTPNAMPLSRYRQARSFITVGRRRLKRRVNWPALSRILQHIDLYDQ